MPSDNSFNSHFYNTYDVISFLGSGGFGYVVEALHKLDGRRVAVKWVHLKEGKEDRVLNEVRALVTLKHKNIVGYFTTWREDPPKSWLTEKEKIHVSDESFNPDDSTNKTTTNCSNGSSSTDNSTGKNNTNDGPGCLHSLGNSKTSNESNKCDDDDDLFERSEAKEESLASHQTGTSQKSSSSTSADSNTENSLMKSVQPLLYIVMELCARKTLADCLSPAHTENKINRLEGLRIFYEIVNGIIYVHDKNIFHRDLKPPNIYFSTDDRKTVKIGDFGLVKEETVNSLFVGEDIYKSYRYGTTFYMSPEQLDKNSRSLVTKKVDIYAMGIILFELLYPFETGMERKLTLENIRLIDTQFPNDMDAKIGTKSTQYQKLIRRLLQQRPDDRPNAVDLEKSMKNDIDPNDYTRLMSGNIYDENINEPRDITIAIENILNSSYEYEIQLDTDEIQHGHFDVCTEHALILLCEENMLKLYDNVNKLDEIPWDWRRWGPINYILWCEAKDRFFILTWCRLFDLSITKLKVGYRSTFAIGNITIIDQIKSIDFKQYPKYRKKGNRLRFITIKENRFLFLNRGYHTVEQWSMQTWVACGRWSKINLNYTNNDEIRLITCSQNGDQLAMNIWVNRQSWIIDFRCTDIKLTFVRRIHLSQNLFCYHKLDLSILLLKEDRAIVNEWLIVDNENSFYTVDGISRSTYLKQIRTTEIPNQLSNGTPQFYFQWFYHHHFLIVTTPCDGGRGKLCFFRVQ